MQRVSARILRSGGHCRAPSPSQRAARPGRLTVRRRPNTAATVEMSGLSFGPSTVRVKTGDTVEWRNKSSFTHSVNADPARFPGDVVIPAGAAPFDSGRIASGAVYRHRFTTPGTYKYVCLPHVDVGMTASVIVDPR